MEILIPILLLGLPIAVLIIAHSSGKMTEKGKSVAGPIVIVFVIVLFLLFTLAG